MKKLIHFLKKIGILRTGGAKGTYKNAKEIPGGMVGDDYVYDYKGMMKKSEEGLEEGKKDE